MKISGINNINYTAALKINGDKRNVPKELEERLSLTAQKIGTSEDTVEINILKPSETKENPQADFEELMSVLSVKTEVKGEKDAYEVKAPNEVRCIAYILNTIQKKFPMIAANKGKGTGVNI
ncbi:MAG: hypothetical protein K6E29_02780 [Cyanobacteria bacterium RUI128]|nr:hypothetical protein [Cyanobacteria bacterium RUI128]